MLCEYLQDWKTVCTKGFVNGKDYKLMYDIWGFQGDENLDWPGK
jgi:hypothetical protein